MEYCGEARGLQFESEVFLLGCNTIVGCLFFVPWAEEIHGVLKLFLNSSIGSFWMLSLQARLYPFYL
ncbi:hypothetical protein FIU95_16530 [Microbulbifer sp. THAF38]|nr:hypothetical protein FIU95_16530 [Microbulbifer sp. THAF38]